MEQQNAVAEQADWTKGALISFDDTARAMVPKNFEGLWRMATIMARSGMMPRRDDRGRAPQVRCCAGEICRVPEKRMVGRLSGPTNRDQFANLGDQGRKRDTGALTNRAKGPRVLRRFRGAEPWGEGERSSGCHARGLEMKTQLQVEFENAVAQAEALIENEITTADGNQMIFYTRRKFTDEEKAAIEKLTREEIGALFIRKGYRKYKVQ